MKLVAAFLFGLIAGACKVTPIAIEPTASHAAALESMTVALLAHGDLCSGVWVSERAILTAAHCIEELEPGQSLIYSTHGDMYEGGLAVVEEPTARKAVVLAVDEAHDLALLRAYDTPPHGIAALHIGPVRQGDRVETMGHPLGLYFSYSSGEVAAFRDKDFGDHSVVWLQSAIAISPGNSGGGLFDSYGRLVAIADATLDGGQNLNLFVPLLYIVPFLAANM